MLKEETIPTSAYLGEVSTESCADTDGKPPRARITPAASLCDSTNLLPFSIPTGVVPDADTLPSACRSGELDEVWML